MRPAWGLTALLLAHAMTAGAASDSDAAGSAGDEAIGRYLGELERTRRLPTVTVSLATLAETVARAEDHLLRGDARAATTVLYGVVESPRHAPFKDDAAFQNAEYLIGRALARGGAYVSAERYLTRGLSRGPLAPYFVPTFRALVDLAIETKAHARFAGLLAAAGRNGPLPGDSASELAYLEARQAYDAGRLSEANLRFGSVGRTSRLYASAAYFRGLIAARGRSWAEARAAFCEIADQPGKDRLAFLIDGRYFALKDLARLALGRISHEQDRHDDAYYFYFSIPEDSDRLAEALFEAAWSMFQKGEHEAAQAFAQQLGTLFPHHHLRAEVEILRANLDVKACAFDSARARIESLTVRYAPIEREVTRALGDERRRRDLLGRLLAPARTGPTADDDGQILSLLKLDSGFEALLANLRDVDVELAEARAAVERWHALGEAMRGGSAARPVASTEALALAADIEALALDARDDPAAARRLGELLLDASLLAFPAMAAGPYASEARQAEALGRRLEALREELARAVVAASEAALRELSGRLRAVLRQARLARIDAVVGKKKRLEIEIERLYQGKLPGALFHKLQAEGTLGDDEEYWPFEGEHWADEYVDYK